jgi:hypothetical protein
MIKSRRMKWAGYVARVGKRNAYRILVGNQKERHHWVDQDVGGWTMDLKEMGWGGMDWIDLAQGRDQWRALANTVMNLRVP